MVQQGAQAAAVDPIAMMAAQMPALAPEWRDVLNALGLTGVAQQTIARAQGITDMESMSVYTKDDVHSIFKQLRVTLIVPQLVEVRTLALARWAAQRSDSNMPLDPTLITVHLLNAEARLARRKRGADDEESIIKPPPDFVDPAKWKVWSELLWNYLGSITNAYRVPLAYVIRQAIAPVTDPALIAGFSTDHERLLSTAPLQGDTFETDNGKVYTLLESLTIKGNYHSYLEPYQANRDGRGAYLALFTHFEGPNIVGMSLEDAYKNIDKLQYTGDRANFSFDSFVDRHVKAYSTIKRLGGDAEDVSDRKKVRDFLSRIKSNEPGIVSAKVQVMANDAMSDDFTSCCDFMRKIVNTVSKAHGRTKERGRNIGALSGGKGELTGLAAQSYPPKKWNKFTARQKIHVWILRGYDPGDIDARGNLKKGSHKKSAGGKNKDFHSTAKQIAMVVAETCRHIGATSKGADNDDDDDEGGDEDAAEEQEGGAGDQFAERRKKKKK
jgi:hypothetical protein